MLCFPVVSQQPDEDWQMLASQRKLHFPAHLSVHMYFNAHLWIKNVLFTTIAKGGKSVFRERGGKKDVILEFIQEGKIGWKGKKVLPSHPLPLFIPMRNNFSLLG